MYKNVFCDWKCRLNGEKEGKGECKHRLIKENEKVNAQQESTDVFEWIYERKYRLDAQKEKKDVIVY